MHPTSEYNVASLKRSRLATQAIFLVCGFGISTWAPMVPYTRDRLGLTDAYIGLLLLCLGAGAIVMMPLTGWLIGKLGSRRVILGASLLMALSLPLLLVMPTPVRMALMLFIFGAGVGSVDVAMNAHGVQVQNLATKPIMSSLHGLFSVGGLCGPLAIGLSIKAGLLPLAAACLVSAFLLTIVLIAYRYLLEASVEKDTVRQLTDAAAAQTTGLVAWLNPAVLRLGFMCFAVFLSEGAVLDWSAIYLRDYRHVEDALTGVGYAFFSIAMAGMRLVGDRLVANVSRNVIVVGGCGLSVAGFLLIIATPWLATTLAGFVLVGLGAANIVPVFFSEAGSLKQVSPTVAISAITTLGYAGQLAGPALLGFIAQQTTLSVALGCTASLLALVGLSYFVKKNQPTHSQQDYA
ncbi:MFS transporter [Spirosoma linguale]|uniref:Major facilitator superfamily MFS_1 n=1 Tax=Spirosoma linguale (strain ATCC 33905 / DSM 74 / LMG 10896 / Claus 1) TaxID=504472 RepID=D2QI11_SPILD|nr:major facilitator superfamily MFS_1 [Spirosoma linguale DSM 74]